VRSSGGLLEFTANGHEMAVPVWGRHHLTSALMAIAVARHLGVTWPAITTGLADFRSPQMRCEVREWRGATIINDCYNASPTAMRAALELLRDFDAAGRRIALCGDMRELGPETPQLHRQVGDQVVTVCGADVLIACGEHAEHVIAGARAAGMAEQCVFTCRDACEAADVARQVVTSDDVLLVKGSRAVGLERCLALLNVA
jgi:UDP-N-acetylmuramoyl-tripeptide--D-alanyl-D-alanine ligase